MSDQANHKELVKKDLLQLNGFIITILVFVLGFFKDILFSNKQINQLVINNNNEDLYLTLLLISSLFLFFASIILILFSPRVVKLIYPASSTLFNVLIIGVVIFILLKRLFGNWWSDIHTYAAFVVGIIFGLTYLLEWYTSKIKKK
jgi:hypothetical protein